MAAPSSMRVVPPAPLVKVIPAFKVTLPATFVVWFWAALLVNSISVAAAVVTSPLISTAKPARAKIPFEWLRFPQAVKASTRVTLFDAWELFIVTFPWGLPLLVTV